MPSFLPQQFDDCSSMKIKAIEVYPFDPGLHEIANKAVLFKAEKY
ncbi:hypothetical protein SynMVIR181_02002 [Synechococcus sp. MVIR-18-1]|nr:hypothetical protein SynMVIR181_02002 [Synechococcus sp. MVIR-18-1]